MKKYFNSVFPLRRDKGMPGVFHWQSLNYQALEMYVMFQVPFQIYIESSFILQCWLSCLIFPS